MGIFSRLATHQRLFHGMTDRLGVDFGKRIGATPDLAGDYRTAVLTCAACREGEACDAFLATTDRADHAPAYCRNRTLLERMARA